MRKINYITLLTCVSAFFAVSCHPSNHKRTSASGDIMPEERPITIALTQYPQQYPVFSVADTTHDFGTVEEGDVVKYSFRFRNTGKKPLVISRASSTCGCTIPKIPKKPVAPGEIGYLRVKFNSANKTGKQMKPIFIVANTMPRQITLSITCNVVSTKK